jgi:hypothetical protein
MTVGMSMVTIMISQQQGADDVNRQSDRGDHDGLIEQDRDWMVQALDRFQRHEHLILTPKLERLVAERILAEVEPLREAGKLGAFLLQLSPSFSPRKHELNELEQLASLFRDERLAIELRNRNWLTHPNREEPLWPRRRGSTPFTTTCTADCLTPQHLS